MQPFISAWSHGYFIPWVVIQYCYCLSIVHLASWELFYIKSLWNPPTIQWSITLSLFCRNRNSGQREEETFPVIHIVCVLKLEWPQCLVPALRGKDTDGIQIRRWLSLSASSESSPVLRDLSERSVVRRRGRASRVSAVRKRHKQMQSKQDSARWEERRVTEGDIRCRVTNTTEATEGKEIH